MDFMGWQELMLIAVVTLIVIGPERLPETLRTLGLWMGRLRRSFISVKSEIEKEIGMDDIRRQLHNEAVMDEMRKIEEDVKSSVEPGLSATEPPPLYSDSERAGNPVTTEATDNQPSEETADPQPPQSVPSEPPPTPRSEAELEAMHAARQKKLKEADSG